MATLVYPVGNKDKENFTFKSNCCYYFENAFNRDDSKNKFWGENKRVLTVLDSSYDDAIKSIESDENSQIKTECVSSYRKNWQKIGEDDEYTLSYINKKGKTKSEIGFLGDLKDGTDHSWSFDEMYTKYNATSTALEDFEAGILQIGNPVINDKEKIEYIDDIYLGLHPNQNPVDSIMIGQTNQEFRAFLLLGSLSSYFTPKDSCLYTRKLSNQGGVSNINVPINSEGGYYVNEGAVLYKYPKVLYLYYGACYHFQKLFKNFPKTLSPIPASTNPILPKLLSLVWFSTGLNSPLTNGYILQAS